ncbi:hypothetical protein DFJ73DRAFT_841517 [Zopfochytrium polystomum]|nr:hypothetical protein DFJ73DRAFT_841517 [Zopfochytrium polystomum]
MPQHTAKQRHQQPAANVVASLIGKADPAHYAQERSSPTIPSTVSDAIGGARHSKPDALTAVDGKDEDTFVTQRGGKLIQGTGLYVPLLPETASGTLSALFQNRMTLQSTLLLQRKKEMHQVQVLLEKKRLEFAKRMDECREKQEELRAKQKQIRDRVTKFEKFLKENDAKRQRANLKALTESRLRIQKETELAALQRNLKEESTKAELVVKMTKKYKIYEQYLQSVVDILPPDYLDINEFHINDILMRHKTLVETNEDLIAMLQQTQDNVEKANAFLSDLVKEKNDQILVYNSQLGTQQKKLDKQKQESAYLEQRLEERDRSGKERMRILGEAKLAINNLYSRVLTRTRGGIGSVYTTAVSTSSTGARTNQQAEALGEAQGSVEDIPTGVLGAKRNAGGLGPIADDVIVGNSAKALAEKLDFIKTKVIDMEAIVQRADETIMREKVERQRKQAALAAEMSGATKDIS